LRLQHIRQGFVGLLAFLTREKHCFFSSVQQDLAVVEKVDLEKFIAEPKHNRVSSFEPLLDVDKSVVSLILYLIDLHLFNLLVQVHYKSLQQKVLLLKVSIFGHSIWTVRKDVFLFQSRIFNKVNVSA
jgi:hypothetical protein